MFTIKTDSIILGYKADYQNQLQRILEYYKNKNFDVILKKSNYYKIKEKPDSPNRYKTEFDLCIDFSGLQVVAFLQIPKSAFWIPVILLVLFQSFFLVGIINEHNFGVIKLNIEVMLPLILVFGIIFVASPFFKNKKERESIIKLLKSN